MVQTEINYPRHLVIIPDGNGRWAEKHGLPIWQGHLKGAEKTVSLVERIQELPIDVVTLWGFSTENWSRSGEEVNGILEITKGQIQQYGSEFIERNIRFRHIGRKDRLPTDLVQLIEDLESRTAQNSGKILCLGLDYGGVDEVERAFQKAATGLIQRDSFRDFLDTANLPDVDLIIRTAGEMRTSGIMPYLSAYAEFVSSPVLFPDFDGKELMRCLEEYSRRQRRFGARLEGKTREPYDWLNLPEKSFTGYMKTLMPYLNLASERFINRWRKGRFYESSGLQEDINVYQNLLGGGKKLRAALVVLGYEMFRGEREYMEGVLDAAISYEVIHNAFLIHDDIMDNSSLRRGQPTVHEMLGIGVALNTGDLGPFRALDTIWQVGQKQDRLVKAQQWLRSVIETTLQGQRRDVTKISLEDLSEKYVYQIYHQKTAVYTVVGPITLGVILAGASRRELGYLNAFGVNLGIAFQITDDHLGLYGDEQVLGKPVGSDLSEAKKTLHFALAWQRASRDERVFLKEVWGKQNPTPNQLDEVRSLMGMLGVREEVLQRAERLSQKAKGVIPKIVTDPVSGIILQEMADFVVRRDY